MRDYLPPYMREAEEWEIIGFCPNCKIPMTLCEEDYMRGFSMMFFEVDYERGWVAGRYCPNCHFVHEPYGGGHGKSGDGKRLEIRLFHGVNRE